MKKHILASTLLAVGYTMISWAPAICQPAPPPEPKLIAPRARILGGFRRRDPRSKEFLKIRKVAQRLLNEKYPGNEILLKSILSVKTQVVAGLNYKLICSFNDKQISFGLIELKIYRDLRGNYSLTKDSYK